MKHLRPKSLILAMDNDLLCEGLLTLHECPTLLCEGLLTPHECPTESCCASVS
jgi:hypothetical protein